VPWARRVPIDRTALPAPIELLRRDELLEVPHAPSSMAISKAPRCEIRCLVMRIHPDGIKAFGHERITQPIGRRGKPIKKLRYMQMARAHALARKLQGRFGTTVSVI
jgi:hypothetical protein